MVIEFLIITAVVYGCKKAWDDATGAASRALGGFYQKAQRQLGTRYGGSPRLHKALAGTATAAYGTVLAPKAFLADWRANWRSNWQAGKDRAEVRWGRPLIPQRDENGSENENENVSLNTATPLSENENYTETFDKNLDEAVSRFKGENGGSENENGSPAQSLSERELEDEAYAWYLADPRITYDGRRAILAGSRKAVVSLYQKARAEQMRLQAEGQGVSHTYLTKEKTEPTVGTQNGSTNMAVPTVNETLNLEALAILAQELTSHANAELDNANGTGNAYAELATKLEANAGALKSLQAEGTAAHVQGAQEALAAAAEGQATVRAALDTYRGHTSFLEDAVQRHQAAAQARQALPDGDKNVAASFHNTTSAAAPSPA